MKTILVPIDYSKSADNACKYAIEIAKSTKTKIILMHTFETPVLFTSVPLMTAEFDYSTLYNSALKEIKRYHKKISQLARNIEIEFILQQGLASARINEIALEKKIDLIVMGTTGRGAVDRALIGSNTSRLIRKAPCMILAVPPKAKYKGFNKIVYATDLLNDNLDHVKNLTPFAKLFGSEILFLNVNTAIFSEDEDKVLKKITRKIRTHVKYPKTSGYLCTDVNISDGINYFLKKNEADCLVMYTHHRGIFQSIFNPSLTNKVAVHTSVPLLVIHETDLVDDQTKVDLQREKMLN